MTPEESNPRYSPLSSYRTIQSLEAPREMGVFTSEGFAFREALFGRDSIEVGLGVLEILPERSHTIIGTMARLQGVSNNSQTEEEPGKIFHEYRTRNIGEFSKEQEEIFERLRDIYGGTENEVISYQTIDATPLYVLLVSSYAQRYGKDLLDERYERKDGKESTIKESVEAALGWIEKKIKKSDTGLLEYQTTNQGGPLNQIWKDSPTSIIHINGEMANHKAPIAPIDAQAVAYEALTQGAKLFPEEQEKVEKWRKMAKQIQEITLSCFWMQDRAYFARALDRDPSGRPRQVQTFESDPARLLNTAIFDDLNPILQRQIITDVVKKICGPDFLTGAGIRARAISNGDLTDFQEYHGSWVTWPVDTWNIIQGLRRQGFYDLAEQLGIRVLNAVNISGSHFEFFYVTPYDEVVYSPIEKSSSETDDKRAILGSSMPQDNLAMTTSSILHLKWQRSFDRRMSGRNKSPFEDWRKEMELETLKIMPRVTLLSDANSIEKSRSLMQSVIVDIETGSTMRDMYLAQALHTVPADKMRRPVPPP